MRGKTDNFLFIAGSASVVYISGVVCPMQCRLFDFYAQDTLRCLALNYVG